MHRIYWRSIDSQNFSRLFWESIFLVFIINIKIYVLSLCTRFNVTVEFGEDDESILLRNRKKAEEYRTSPKFIYKMIQEYIENKYYFKVHTAWRSIIKGRLTFILHRWYRNVESLREANMKCRRRRECHDALRKRSLWLRWSFSRWFDMVF